MSWPLSLKLQLYNTYAASILTYGEKTITNPKTKQMLEKAKIKALKRFLHVPDNASTNGMLQVIYCDKGIYKIKEELKGMDPQILLVKLLVHSFGHLPLGARVKCRLCKSPIKTWNEICECHHSNVNYWNTVTMEEYRYYQ